MYQSAKGLRCVRSDVAAAGRSLELGGTCPAVGARKDSCVGGHCIKLPLVMGLLRAAVKPWSMGFIVQKGRWGSGRCQLSSQAPRDAAGSTLDPLSGGETKEEMDRPLCQGRGSQFS